MKTDGKSISENSDWERLYAVIQSTGMSTNAFAYHIGLPRSENLYQIKKGNHGISKTLAETIHRLYPEFSVGWLLSGEVGNHVPPHAGRIVTTNDSIVKIPVYTRFVNGAKPTYHRYISEDFIDGAQMAIINKDQTATPRIPIGAIVFVKKSEPFFPGKIYFIVTGQHNFIRKIRHVENSEKLRLEAIDRQNYDDIVLDPNQIIGLYAVEKVLIDF